MGKRMKSAHKEEGVMGKRVMSLTDDETSYTSASSTDETSPEINKRRRRRARSLRNARRNEELLTCSRDNDILHMLKLLNVKFDKQSKQNTECKNDISEIRKELKELIENKDDTSEMRKQLEKVLENQNVQSKELEKLHKQLELHTNGRSHASDAPRSQSNQLEPPRYRLVFTSGNIDIIEKGQTIDISVALVQGNNDQTVENGPLASATVELVVINAEFNEHDNQHNWSREDFEYYIKKPRHGNTATGDADQSVKSIVSNGRFNLVRGVKCHSDSTIFENSGNKKVRLGVMVVFPLPTEERVLEGVSNPFYVRGHDRPGRQNNLRHNSSNRQRQALVDNDYQEQNSSMPDLPHPSKINSTQTAGNRQALVDNDYQEQNSLMPNLPHSSWINSTQIVGNGLDIIGGQSQLPFPGTNMLSTELSSALVPPYLDPGLMSVAQAIRRQNDTRFNTNPTTLAVQLVWDRPDVEPSKRHWNLLDQLMLLTKFNNCGLPTTLLMQEHLDPLTIISKEAMQTRRNRGVIIEPLEPDDSDEEQQVKRKMCSKYKLRFVNKVCEAYHTRDPVKADDGSLLKVALFDENRKITYGPLSSAAVQIVVLHGDFNGHGQDYWTSEEFSRYEVCPRPGEEASSVLGGNCILVLADGEACLGDAFFQMTSCCARTGKFKMGVRLASAQEERIQEGVSEPFWVKDRHFAGEYGRVTGIWPEDDTALVVQATIAELEEEPAGRSSSQHFTKSSLQTSELKLPPSPIPFSSPRTTAQVFSTVSSTSPLSTTRSAAASSKDAKGWAVRFLTAVAFLAAGILFALAGMRSSGGGTAEPGMPVIRRNEILWRWNR